MVAAMTTSIMRSTPDGLRGTQLGFDEMGTPLREVTFVVVDLETTGGSAGEHTITEIGAVKVRGGEVIGELATLVDTGRGVPPVISRLTGITTAMLEGAPSLRTVLPSFLEFSTGAVLVAHNAPFDTGFLRAACSELDLVWPRPAVLCTVRLARRVLSRDEAPSVRLSTLAPLLGARTTPTHRALDDARATVDVLHALLERVGNLGVHSLEELLAFLPEVTAAQRRKRGLAAHLPHSPGVYLFRGPADEVLYVGTASDLRRRVRSYFTGSETRRRVREMVGLAERVDHVECAHPLEAAVRELRLLAAHAPPYNRRSKFPHRVWWITLTDEAFPRLSVVRTARDGAVGPFRARREANETAVLLAELTGLRTCTQRIAARSPSGTPCVLHELARCAAPCAGLQSRQSYLDGTGRLADLVAGRTDTGLHTVRARLEELAARGRFESAAVLRDRAATLVAVLRRGQRLGALAQVEELVGARTDRDGGWHLVVVRHGRLAAAGHARRGTPPLPVVAWLVASAETVVPGPGPLRGGPAEEVDLVERWLSSAGARLVRTSQAWTEPAAGAGAWAGWADQARRVARPDADGPA